jgi:hypothetical protein
MIQTPDEIKRYHSAHERFLKPAIVNFFAREFQGAFGPIIRENIAGALIKLIDEVYPEITRIKPGQILWSALDKNTRGDSPNRRYKTVVLTIVTDEDINMLEKGAKSSEMKQKVIARIINEAYQQGGILSMRDIGLMLVTRSTNISKERIRYEKKKRIVLPHTGVLHDMGSSITHKYQIVYKYVIEKKDPVKIAWETNHSPAAVDRYLKDFNRVKTLIFENKDIDYINLVTNIAKPVIKQYQQLIDNYVK